jgi:hypothetical protein
MYCCLWKSAKNNLKISLVYDKKKEQKLNNLSENYKNSFA